MGQRSAPVTAWETPVGGPAAAGPRERLSVCRLKSSGDWTLREGGVSLNSMSCRETASFVGGSTRGRKWLAYRELGGWMARGGPIEGRAGALWDGASPERRTKTAWKAGLRTQTPSPDSDARFRRPGLARSRGRRGRRRAGRCLSPGTSAQLGAAPGRLWTDAARQPHMPEGAARARSLAPWFPGCPVRRRAGPTEASGIRRPSGCGTRGSWWGRGPGG